MYLGGPVEAQAIFALVQRPDSPGGNSLEVLPGLYESVREVPVTRDLHAFDPEVLELTMVPETVQELVIRLDGGHVITATHSNDMQRLQPGQRVRVTLTTTGPLVEAQ